MSSETVEVLFSKHSVSEIRDVEKKTRQEIETKKEDLRQMVGERYRDLIEAADTIAEMKSCAGNLSTSVKSLQKYAMLKFDDRDSVRNEKQRGFSVQRFMEISAQVKMIMEVSETIWSQIENGNMIEATHLYLQSRQVLKNLHLDGSTTYCPILSWFPVLGQQAQALDNLRSTILAECRKLMSDDQLDFTVVAEAICSTILLENRTMESAFDEFIQIRLSAIESKFKSNLDMGATKLSKAVTVMISTLKQVNELFVTLRECDEKKSSKLNQKNSSDVGLVQHVLRKAFQSFHNNVNPVLRSGFSEEKLWTKHLPESVARLILVTDLNGEKGLETSKLQEKCNQWVTDCQQIIKSGTADILVYLNSFKGLKSLRKTVWETLGKESRDTEDGGQKWTQNTALAASNDSISDWRKACLYTLGSEFCIWESVLKDLFLNKVKVLCENLFSDLLIAAKQDIRETIVTIKSDDHESMSVSEFIWSESSNDILPDTAWRQVSIKKTRDLKGGLGLKALSVTPLLHQICQRLNDGVRQNIVDLSNYVPDIAKRSRHKYKKLPEQNEVGSVSQSERAVIHKYFQESCTHCLHDLFNCFQDYQKRYGSDVSTEDANPHEILFLSNLCRNFCNLCNEFYNGCVLGTNVEDASFKRQMSSSMTSSMSLESAPAMATSAVWDEMSENFLTESNKFLKIWSTMAIKKEIEKLRTWLLNLGSTVEFFETIPCWDNIKIEEESETGSKVESEIKIPMSSSWPVQHLLFSTCRSLGQVGGHSFNQYALHIMTHGLLTGILHSFIHLKNVVSDKTEENGSTGEEKCRKFQPTQSWALQKLFDLRVCHGVLHSSTSSNYDNDDLYEIEDDAFTTLVDWLEGYIDPFDLDVFTPYLTKNVQRAVSSTRSLFGFVSVDKSDFHQLTSQSSKSGNSSHNIMPLVPDCPRFSYLPISTKMSRRDKMELPASVKNSMPLSSALKQLTEVDKKMEGGRKQSLYSKLGALSSSWLSSVTSES